jgi:hypothetical protein
MIVQTEKPKPIRFPVDLSDGSRVFWSLRRYAHVTGVHGAPSGPLWILKDHEGHERGMESNWKCTVEAVRLIVSNYGGTTLLS